MPLIQLLQNSPEVVATYSIEQIVAMAGDGQLRDGSECSRELRFYLSSLSVERLREQTNRCLEAPFLKSGSVLQDIVNELARRLDYQVIDGFYQGRTNAIGFDGIWTAPDSHSIVAEVKTSDAYRINLDTIAQYRAKLAHEGRISTENSSMLIVVGREDTGDLEAQIRGSRHAWDIRVISTDALINLVALKEATDEDATLSKIRSLLRPFEYTRLDNIIDVMFSAARDVEAATESEQSIGEAEPAASEEAGTSFGFTPPDVIKSLRGRMVATLAKRLGQTLVAHKRALFWSPDHMVRAACTISKRYERGSTYWYAYHPSWDEFLKAGVSGSFVLGCVDRPEAYALPFSFIHSHLDAFHQTVRPDGKNYWHIHLDETPAGGTKLNLPLRHQSYDLSEFALPLL